jgi:hypothetical protein
MKYKINDIIFFHEKEYGKILEIKYNKKYCFEEILFENFITNKKDLCYKKDLRIDKNNKLQYYPEGE